jgi:hypothetical protein
MVSWKIDSLTMDALLFLGGVLDRDALLLLLLDGDASSLSLPSGGLAALLSRDYFFPSFLSVLALGVCGVSPPLDRERPTWRHARTDWGRGFGR